MVDRRRRLQPGQRELTAEQQAEAGRFARERIHAQLSTEPVDKEVAETLLRTLYIAAGVAAPHHIHWLGGPLELIAALSRNDESISIGDVFTERVAHCVWDDLLCERDEIARLRTGIVESVDFRVRSVQRRAEARIQARFGRRWSQESLAAAVWNVVGRPMVGSVTARLG